MKRYRKYSLIFCMAIFATGLLLQADETFGVPIPVIGIDPNEGTLLGILLAVVTEDEGRITRIMAPVAATNDLVGYSFDFNCFGFPSDETTYELYLSHTSKNFWGYRVEYESQKFLMDFLTLSTEISFEKTASNRFYGIGPDTDKDNETNYTMREIWGEVSLKAEIWNKFYANLSLKGRRSWVRRGTVEEIKSLEERFPTIEGREGGYSLPLQIALEYDTRDSRVTPSSGIHSRLFFEIADKAALSSFSIRRYGAVGKMYFTFDEEKRFVTALQALIEYTEGDDIPFYELSTLGGSNNLRGFGKGRFYDSHRVLCNIEERIRLFRWPVGEIFLDVETAAFLDVGQVVSSLRKIDYRDMKAVGGLGLRFVVRSQIVAKVDIGYGSEGSQVFAGLHYPF